MDVTTPQSEPDQDNSSLQNPSTNPAEAGTTDETRDDDHETSSIEALNWSEVEEEELAAAQQAEAALSTALGILPPEKKVNNKTDKDDDNMTNNDSSTNEEGSVLSTSLLQSINSTVADEDPQARKLSVIENWASEVTSAVERGEIEMAEDFPEENETTAEEDENNDFVGARKRKGKKSSPELVASMMSTVSNGESSVDPLSNAAVLDDGPIWNKGPRSYTFQENSRFNQKLTFCLLIAVVLAIGLGLGNLVAHQECEAEYKASQQQQTPLKHTTDKVSVHSVPTTTTPAPIIPDRSTDSSMMGSQLPTKRPTSYADSSISGEAINEQFAPSSVNTNEKRQVHQESIDQSEQRRRRRDEPVIDPKYKVHAETVSNVVHTLDRLSRKIDQNENTTRKLQGVLMIPDEEEKSTETSTESNLLYDEEIHMDEDQENIVDDSDAETDVDDDENEGAIIEDLIEAIEQTPDYIEMQSEKRRWEEYDRNDQNRRHSNLFDTDSEQDQDHYPGEQNDMEMLIKSMRQFKDFQRRFIGSERKRLRQDQKYNRFNWRLPEEYTVEEKNALRVRYRSNWQEFLKLIKTKISDPVEALFGVEEDEEERTYEDIFRFSYVDPKDEQSELDLLQKRKDSPSENEKNVDNGRGQTWEVNSDSNSEEPIPILPEPEDIHDTIKTETRGEQQLIGEPTTASFKSEPVQPERVEAGDELGKSTITADQGTLESPVPKKKNIRADNLKIGDSRTQAKENQGEGDRLSSVKENKATLPIPSLTVNKPRKTNSQNKNTNDRKLRAQSADLGAKTGKVQSKKQTDQKNKQGKQNFKNESMRFNKDQNANSASNGVKIKNAGKDRKLRNVDSNTSFENLKGKNKKRAASSPERNGNAGTEALFADVKHEKNSKPTFPKKKSQIEDNENSETKRGRGDTSFDKENQKVKTPDNHNNNDNHQNKFNGNNARNYKNDQSKDARYQERRNARTEQRNRQQSNENQQQKNKEKANAYPQRPSSSKPNQESKDVSSEETQFRQQKTDFNVKHESRNNYKNSGNENGKKSKSWQSKEKIDRKRERGSSWAN